MKILHTSDWHLGRTFHGHDMRRAQSDFLDFLVEFVASNPMDAVIVAGDIYDRALPAPDSIELFDRAIDRLLETGTRVVVTSGNHDSGSRLGYGRHRFEASGLHIRSRLDDIGWPVEFDDANGRVLVYGIPYLEPALVRERLGVDSRTHQAVLSAAMERIHDDAATRGDARIVVAAHAFITGAAASDSERDVSVGGLGLASADIFAGVDYTALGHIHKPQSITPTVRYSGSPIAYSFSEEGVEKSMLIVELDRDESGQATTRVETVPIPQRRRIVTLTASVDSLRRDEQYGNFTNHFVAAKLTDESRIPNVLAVLRERFPYIVHVEWLNRPDTMTDEVIEVAPRNDEQVFEDFHEFVTGQIPYDRDTESFCTAMEEVLRA